MSKVALKELANKNFNIEDISMFCYQCEQTRKPMGCYLSGVCTKTPSISNKQDFIIAYLKALSNIVVALQRSDIKVDDSILNHIAYSLFLTLTNTNFNEKDHDECIAQIKENIRICKGMLTTEISEDLIKVNEGELSADVLIRIVKFGDTITGLQELITYGMKGLSAYLYHAIRLNNVPRVATSSIPEILAFLSKEPTDVNQLLINALRVGELSHMAMKALDEAHTRTYGNPVPTKIKWGPQPGKCILISGHDLLDLYDLLVETEGKGINVYTHGEMITCNGYPELKKFKHFVGHYGSAWQNQKKEFSRFPGPIIMTTNCIMQPPPDYSERLWTTGPVGYEGIKKIRRDGLDRSKWETFKGVIDQALQLQGFPDSVVENKNNITTDESSSSTTEHHNNNNNNNNNNISTNERLRKFHSMHMREIVVGYGHNAVTTTLMDEIINAINNNKLHKLLVIGGCDGYEVERSYFTNLSKNLPKNCAILTLACGKFRMNYFGLDSEYVPDTKIPRLIDCGQCNDNYSVMTILSEIANRMGKKSINELPIGVCLSWFEQKAVADLLSLLWAGVNNILIGPNAPLFLTADALGVLNEKFGLRLVSTVEKDLVELLK